MTTTGIELEFVCDACDRPIADGEGCLYVDFSEMRRRRNATAERDESRDPQEALNIASILGLPPKARWYLHHDACRPEHLEADYDIDVARVRTWRQLVSWTAHLMDKNWLVHTSWSSLLGNAANGRDRRIVELARGDAA